MSEFETDILDSTDDLDPDIDSAFQEEDVTDNNGEEDNQMGNHDISRVEFPELASQESTGRIEEDMLSTIPVSLSVELGRTKISLSEVFELNEGAIIELDRLVGEPLDLMVNGHVIAQGEVVAIDNNYGLRITQVTSKTPKV